MVQRGLSTLCEAFLQIAKAHADTVMPGYTHTQTRAANQSRFLGKRLM